MKINIFLFNYVLFFFNCISANVLIITHSYNRPDFIEMQHKTFKKFIQDDYEYVVFNDARDQHMEMQINAMCSKLNIKSIRIPQEIHTRPYLHRLPGDPIHRPNIRHANCVQYSLDTVGFDYDGTVLIIDSDLFLIRPLCVAEYMKDKDIGAFIKGSDNKVWYLCPNLCFLDMNKLPDKRSLNFNCGIVNSASVDSGGWTYLYLTKYPQLTVVNINSTWSHNLFLGNVDINRPTDHSISNETKIETYARLGFNDNEIRFLLKKPDTFEFYLDNHFLHYHGGTNHNNLSQAYHDNKTRIFNELLNDIL